MKIAVIFFCSAAAVLIAFIIWGFYLNRSAQSKVVSRVFSDFALSQTADSLNPKSEVNVKNIQSGIGFPLKVVEVGNGFARVAAASTRSKFSLPLGWNAFDNGQKVMVYTPDGEVVIAMAFVDGGGAHFSEIEGKINKEYSGYESQGAKVASRKLDNGILINKATGVVSNAESLYMVSALFPNPQNERYFLKWTFSCPKNLMEKFDGLVELMAKNVEPF